MIEMIYQMASDRLWIYTAIVGALFGAAFLAYFRSTHAGIYLYMKFDEYLDKIRDYFGLTWFNQPEDAWRKQYPKITNKIDELERRIAELENPKPQWDKRPDEAINERG